MKNCKIVVEIIWYVGHLRYIAVVSIFWLRSFLRWLPVSTNQYFLVQNHLVVTFSSKPTDSFHFQLPLAPWSGFNFFCWDFTVSLKSRDLFRVLFLSNCFQRHNKRSMIFIRLIPCVASIKYIPAQFLISLWLLPYFLIVLMLMLMFLSIVRTIKFYTRQYIQSVG